MADLGGRTIAVTRAETQLGEARRLFEAAGASVVDLPALVVTPPDEWGPLDDALAELEDFHWLVFSSGNGVEAVEQRLRRLGRSLAHRPSGLRIAAVGRKTARQLEALGAPADFIPPSFVADSLLEHFPAPGWGLRLLLPRVQSGGRTLLAEAFAEAGARVVEVAAYETRCPAGLRRGGSPGAGAPRWDHLQQRQNRQPHLRAAGGGLWARLGRPTGGGGRGVDRAPNQ